MDRTRRFCLFWRIFIPPLPAIRLCVLLLLLSAGAAAQKLDSATLFSRSVSGDETVRLAALKVIYSEYYRFYPVKANPYVIKAIALAKKLKDKSAEAEATYALSYYYQCRSLLDSAYYFCNVGLDLSSLTGSSSLMAQGYSELGEIYRLKGETVKAVEFLKKSLNLDSSNQSLVSSNCFSLGILYGDAGCPEKSVYYHLKALKIKEAQKKWIDAGYLSVNISGFYFQSGYKEKGYLAWGQALDYFRKGKYIKGEGYVYNIMGMTYLEKSEYENALKYFRKSLAINYLDTITVRSGFSFNLTNLGDTWMKLKRYDSAQFYFSRALAFSSRDQEYLPMACTYLSLGELYLHLKRYQAAIDFLNKGLYYSRLVNYRAQWEQAYNLLSECYNQTGDHEKALEYMKKRNGIKDSIFTLKAHQEVANMMIRYESQKKDQQISSLNEVSDAQQKKIRFAILAIFIMITVSGVGAYLIWFYYRKKVRPKVKSLEFIQDQISIEKEGDNRRLRALERVLPPELKPFHDDQARVNGDNKDLIVQLEAMMLTDKAFLNENLNLSEAARLLDTNTTYLSRLINEHYKVNFSSFVNRYRIEEAKKMILDAQFNNLSIEGIAKSSGFRSKSTFNQVFKQSTGLTPSEFALRNGRIRA